MDERLQHPTVVLPVQSPQPPPVPLPAAVIDEPPQPHRIRRTSDAAKAAGWLGVVAGLVVLGNIALGTASGLEADLTSAVTTLPDLLLDLVSLLSTLPLALMPLLILGDLVYRRRWWSLGLGILAAAIVVIVGEVFLRWAPDHLGLTLLDALTTVSQRGELTPVAFPVLGGVVALASVDGLGGRPRMAAAVWGFAGAYVVLLLFNQSATPLALALTVAFARAVGLAVRYVLGTANPRPSGLAVAHAMARVAQPLSHLHLLEETDDGRSYTGTGLDGRRLRISVIDRDRRAAGFLYQLWRRLRVQSPVERRSTLSLRRAVDQAAAPTLAAMARGVRVPHLASAAAVGSDAVLLAFEEVPELRTLDDLDPDLLTDDLLAEIWRQVRMLHRAGIAHEDLHASNLAVDSSGEVWLLGLTAGEIAADQLTLRIDDAELLITTAMLVGPDRAVAAALRELTPSRLGEALPLLQPIALSRTTRRDLKARRGLLAQVQDAVIAASPSAPTDPVRLERLRPRIVVSLVALSLAVIVLLGQLGNVDLVSVITDADPLWALVALGFSVVTYLGATTVIRSFAPIPLPFGRTLLAQFAATFVSLVAPAAVGNVGTNTRYVQQAGVPPTLALASVGTSQLFVFGSYLILILGFGIFTGTQQETDIIPGRTVLYVVLALGAVGTLVAAIPWTRRAVIARARPLLHRTLPRLIEMLREPRRVAAGLGGAMLLNLAYAAALTAAVYAYGGSLAYPTVGFVYLAAGAIGNAVPTPGGIGAVEAALAAGLTAAGLDAATAVQAALLFRATTFWLPMLPGWLSFTYLQRKEAL